MRFLRTFSPNMQGSAAVMVSTMLMIIPLWSAQMETPTNSPALQAPETQDHTSKCSISSNMNKKQQQKRTNKKHHQIRGDSARSWSAPIFLRATSNEILALGWNLFPGWFGRILDSALCYFLLLFVFYLLKVEPQILFYFILFFCIEQGGSDCILVRCVCVRACRYLLQTVWHL